MNFWIVVGHSFKGGVKRAVVCEERALAWVRAELRDSCIDVEAVPAECHWSAEVRHPTAGAERDCKEV